MRRITRWFLRPKLASLFALLLLMLLLRLSWGWYVDRQLQSQFASIRARGEPLQPSQITYETIPDAENAVILYRQAVKAMAPGVDCPRNSNLEYPDYHPRTPDWIKYAQASEKAHAPAFSLARQARQRPRAQFRTSLVEMPDLYYLTEARDLANTIADGAEFAHLTGDDLESLERLLDLLHLSRSLQSDDYVVSHMVAVGIDALACHAIQNIAPGLTFPPGEARSAILKQKLHTLIDQLLDEQLHRDTLKRTLRTARIRYMRWWEKKSTSHPFLSPLAGRDLIRALPNIDLMLQAADCTDWPRTQQILQRCRWDAPPDRVRQRRPGPLSFSFNYESLIPRYSRWFSGNADFFPWFERYHRIIAERRLTAISLACQLYRADHGDLPQTLDQLVPAYLRAVPRDPLHSDGRTIGYTVKTHTPPLTGPRPLLYFDPGGGDVVPRPEPLYGWYTLPVRGAPVRQYRDLTRFTPAPPAPLPKAVDNNPDKPNAPGQDPENDQRPQ